MQEARLLARVDHPNVVRVFGIDEHDGAVGLAMEFIEGLTLKRLLAERGVFSAREAALTGFDLCGAVAAVHRAGLIHRDVKTQNVMRAVGGRIVLMDFGGVGNLSDRDSFVLSTKGTPLYLAPEVLEGSPSSVASDVYSLGVLLFNLVTGRHPVEGASTEDIMQAHRRHETLSLADLRPDLPDAFVLVVNRAIDRDAARRFRSAGAMQDALIRSMSLGTATESFAVVPPAERVLPSIAVLPFANLGPDTDVEYFCEGLAEELVTALGKVHGLRVVSRTASLRLRGTTRTCRRSAASSMPPPCWRARSARWATSCACRRVWSTVPTDSCSGQKGTASHGRRVRRPGRHRRPRRRALPPVGGGSAAADSRVAPHRQSARLSPLSEGPVPLGSPLLRRADDGARLLHACAGRRCRLFARACRPRRRVRVSWPLLGGAAEGRVRPRRCRCRTALQIDPEVPEVQTSLALIALGRDWNIPLAMQHLARAVELDGTQALPRIYHA